MSLDSVITTTCDELCPRRVADVPTLSPYDPSSQARFESVVMFMFNTLLSL